MSAPPLPRLFAPLTIPASLAYRSAVAARNRHYDRGRSVHRLSVPVLSIGNITTGGAGKTPTVVMIVTLLRRAGWHPAICMRGYGATATQPSDEHLEYQSLLPEVPVIASPNRVAAATSFLKKRTDVDCIVLDDGFQHRRLYRDLDLVLIDATQSTLEDYLLPHGHLREPPANLRRADAVMMTHAHTVDAALSQAVAQHHGLEPLAWSRHHWSALRCITARGTAEQPVNWLANKRVATMLGIGQPRAVHDQLRRHGASIAANVPARDHERFDQAKLRLCRERCRDADALVVTGKDWVKLDSLLDLSDWPVPVVVPTLAIDVFEGKAALEAMVLGAVDRCTTEPDRC